MENNSSSKSKIYLYFLLIIFASQFVVLIVFGIAAIILVESHVMEFTRKGGAVPFFAFMILSSMLSGLISLLVGRKIIRPVDQLNLAIKKISQGEFDYRITTKSRIPEIQSIFNNVNTMAHELSSIETLRSDFVVNVSHEFKTPIAAIDGYTSLLQGDNLTDTQKEYVEKVLINTKRLSEMTKNILCLSRLENINVVTEKTTFRLDEQIRQTILMLEPQWTKKEIEFDIDLPKVSYCTNESMLSQVWYNIISNAIKFSKDKGEIKISIQEDESKITTTIKDNGCGMSEDTTHHIFEKFYQGEKSHTVEGNGLGLALTKRIIELCKGTIEVKSTIGNGSTFIVHLPK